MKRNKIEDEKREIVKALVNIKRVLENVTEGSVSTHKRNGKFYYSKNILNNGKKKCTYLSIDEENELKILATKRYYKKLKPALEKELKALECMESKYLPERKFEIYDELGELKQYVKPLFKTQKDLFIEKRERLIEEWNKQKVETLQGYNDGRKYLTKQGEMVRSKSELLLANLFYDHSDEIMYRYEQKLYLPKTGGSIFPDFNILCLNLAKVKYWEHAGMIGDENYSSDFAKKVSKYGHNEFVWGENFIFTFETSGETIDMALAEKYLKMYCGCTH